MGKGGGGEEEEIPLNFSHFRKYGTFHCRYVRSLNSTNINKYYDIICRM